MATDSPPRDERPVPPPRWRFAPREQVTIALLLGLAAVALAARTGWWAIQGAGVQRFAALPHRSATLRLGLNSASWSELATLPGVGEILAREIIAYRQEHGPFRAIAELGRVRGIGPHRLRELSPFLSLD